MRVGLSWDLGDDDAATRWKRVGSEVATADDLGYDSIWVRESRERAADCPSPAIWLTYLAHRTSTVQLRAIRLLTHANPVRVAEEIGVLDVFARGRSGLAYAAASPQGVPVRQLHETIEFVTHAWALDEFRYRGEHLRFPSHTPDDAPEGVTTPEPGRTYTPQWDWGPDTPDFLAITPKPYATRPPVYCEITDDETLEWAAHHGISPLVAADTPTTEAVDRLTRYRAIASGAGRSPAEVEPVVERRIIVNGTGDDHTLGGSPDELVQEIRDLAARTSMTHLVWQRVSDADGDLFQFAREIQPMLQA